MHRPTLLTASLALLLAGSTTFAIAQNAPSSSTPASAGATTTQTGTATKQHMTQRGNDMRRPHADGKAHGQRGGVVGDLRGLERLYMQAGRSKELSALYNDVLAKSQNPRVRDYVYHRLARLQAQPANVDQAIATLRKGLDENLTNDAKMRTEREQMRATWQQRRANATSPAAPSSAEK